MVAAHLGALALALGLWFRWFDPWYESIELPEWSPSTAFLRWAWAGGLVLSGISFLLLDGSDGRLSGLVVALLWAQVALAVGWAGLFFRRRRARSAFSVICMQWTATALAAAAAAALFPVAGLLLLPWLALTAYVGGFNFFVWQLEQQP